MTRCLCVYIKSYDMTRCLCVCIYKSYNIKKKKIALKKWHAGSASMIVLPHVVALLNVQLY